MMYEVTFYRSKPLLVNQEERDGILRAKANAEGGIFLKRHDRYIGIGNIADISKSRSHPLDFEMRLLNESTTTPVTPQTKHKIDTILKHKFKK